jgi:hypothetical protein
VDPIVASPADVERLLRLYDGATLAEVAARTAEWDHPDAFLDEEGRLCVPDSPPNDLPRVYVEGQALEKLLDHYGVEAGDLECLRRRMILEGSWKAEEVAIENGRLFVATEDQEITK